MSKQYRGLTLLEVLVVAAILALMLPVATPARRRAAMMKDCENNLRQLGAYTTIYVARYGSGREYPPAPGYGFLDTLRRVPDEQTAIAAGQHGLFVCRVTGNPPSPTNLDYRQPNWPVGGQPSYGRRPIACDRTNNHDVNGTEDMNVLLLDGTVIRANPGSSEWNTAVQYTTDQK